MYKRQIQGGGVTRIGNNNLLMVNVHVAHDCQIKNNCILANNATLAGHVELDDFVIVGGMSAIHQFVIVGAHVMLGGGSMVSQDVPPYVLSLIHIFCFFYVDSFCCCRLTFTFR